jgi:hypothetical protein
VLDRGGAAPVSGSPAARECGRGGSPERRGSGREGQRAVGVASRGLMEVEECRLVLAVGLETGARRGRLVAPADGTVRAGRRACASVDQVFHQIPLKI